MNTATTLPRPNTRDMLSIHQIFRDAFGCSPQLVGSVCNERSDRVEPVAAYYANVLAFLRAHHEGEDELIWPKLIERVPDQGDLVARMQAAHEGLAEALAESEKRLAAWTASPDIDHGASLAASLAMLGVLCAAHFDEEERRSFRSPRSTSPSRSGPSCRGTRCVRSPVTACGSSSAWCASSCRHTSGRSSWRRCRHPCARCGSAKGRSTSRSSWPSCVASPAPPAEQREGGSGRARGDPDEEQHEAHQ
jgi:hypothetical protein